MYEWDWREGLLVEKSWIMARRMSVSFKDILLMSRRVLLSVIGRYYSYLSPHVRVRPCYRGLLEEI